MHRFDYSFLEGGLLPTAVVNFIADIYTLRASARVRQEQYPEVFTALESVARVQSVKSSNALEGIVTTDQRLRSILNGSSAPQNPNELEIAGYRDALAQIHQQHDSLDISKADLLRLHALMLHPAGYATAGKYKSADNYLLEVDPTGRRRVRFRPISAAATPDAMEQLILAYREARDNPHLNQLLLIPCVILDFLCIHPFQDGNGRMSRLLSLLLLYKNGFDAGKYISFEEQINLRKGNYYAALEQSSSGWHENQQDYAPFMLEFLTTLYLCYRELDKRFAVVGSRKVSKHSRIEGTILNSPTPLSKSYIGQILPDVSATTIEAVLGQLVRAGKIRKIGAGRATRYLRT